jgi:hypothetical protein
VVSIILLYRGQRCHWYRCPKKSDVKNDTAEILDLISISIYKGSMTLRKSLRQWSEDFHRDVNHYKKIVSNFRGVKDTAEYMNRKSILSCLDY